MNDVIRAYKRKGETMGELTERVRKELALPEDEKITFAGRLDPLAEGLVLYLARDRRFERDTYLNLDKAYEFDIVFGVSTDTGDPLGMINNIATCWPSFDLITLRSTAQAFIGTQTQVYPHFSSPRISANQNRTKEIEIFEVEVSSLTEVSSDLFLKETLKDIGLVRGQFRQDEIIRAWKSAAQRLPGHLLVAHSMIRCSSGTYVRVLAEKIGEGLHVPALAQNIKRTAMGEFTDEKNIV